MSIDFSKITEWLDSPEGEAAMDDWFEKIEREEEHTKRWVDKFKVWSADDIDVALEKLMNKYYSDEYRDREYFKCGCEPREPFLWLAWCYAIENCPECTDEEYFNCFTGGAYHIGSYVIQIMHGQGAALRIDKYRQ
jgi:hypothetical protein